MTQPNGDWRLAVPEARRRPLRIWLWSIAATTAAVVVVGGITRLTLSGLSIVDWRPVTGVIPPLGADAWEQAFEQYRQFPEYRTWRQGMTLQEFRFIFLWEYLHRLLARSIGLVFLVPFLVFLARGWLSRPLLRRTLALFGLGALQGLMGWLMVSSGLVERPSVSHYRLAAHLVLALFIFGYAVWLARELGVGTAPQASAGPPPAAGHRFLVRGLGVVGGLLAVQIVWGAFTAGLKAGKYYPTFPLMGGRLVPAELLWMDAALLNFVANPIAVQWTHRVLGTLLVAAVLLFAAGVRARSTDATSRRFAFVLAALIGAQYALGIVTLVQRVPVSLGVAHQAAALLILAVWLIWLHHLTRGAAHDGSAALAPVSVAHAEPATHAPVSAAHDGSA